MLPNKRDKFFGLVLISSVLFREMLVHELFFLFYSLNERYTNQDGAYGDETKVHDRESADAHDQDTEIDRVPDVRIKPGSDKLMIFLKRNPAAPVSPQGISGIEGYGQADGQDADADFLNGRGKSDDIVK